jgi:glyoxylase-like metal-dependent hydrolase (beta-lactamase superfamily II)
MRERAEGVWQLPGLIPNIINTYLIATPAGEVLIDAGTRWATARILRALRGRKMAMVALTHVHPDHQGAAHEVCTRYGLPLACHEADVDVMEGRRRMAPGTGLVRLGDRLWSGPPHPVSVRWHGGETLGEWEVVPTPGHTPGHVTFFRRRDGVAIVGDLVRHASLRHGYGRVSEPPHVFSTDPMENRRSIRKLVDLRPRLMLFGHGPPLSDLTGLERMLARLERRSQSNRG